MADSSEADSDSTEYNENVAIGPVERATQAGADLRTPQKAEISNKRSVQTNPGNAKRSKWGSKDPKHVSLWERVEQYENEYFTVVNGKLRCDACKEFISKKKSSIVKHVQSRKHLTGKKEIERRKTREQSIVEEKRSLKKCVCFGTI